ncbi:MAG: DUF2062 domain-containing protein [Candidatus Omnitrophota bacterium]
MEDRPHSVALGVAIGILFGITPLFGIKMPLAVALSFILRGNIIATLIIVGMADLFTPALVAVYVLEYKLGCFIFAMKTHAASIDLINDPGQVPQWAAIINKARPLLTGSIIFGSLVALPAYVAVRAMLTRGKARNK